MDPGQHGTVIRNLIHDASSPPHDPEMPWRPDAFASTPFDADLDHIPAVRRRQVQLVSEVDKRWSIRRALYPGSYLDLSPSTAIASVIYVDTDRRAANRSRLHHRPTA